MQRKHNELRGNLNGENHGGRERKIHCNNGDYNGILWSARISEIKPFLHWKRSPIYAGPVCWIRLWNIIMFEYLTTYHGGG